MRNLLIAPERPLRDFKIRGTVVQPQPAINYLQFYNFSSLHEFCLEFLFAFYLTVLLNFQFFDTDQEGPSRSIHTMLSVLSIAFSPDGKFAVGTHADATAQVV